MQPLFPESFLQENLAGIFELIFSPIQLKFHIFTPLILLVTQAVEIIACFIAVDA